jgi:EAL domain-containing protein (putative c-di-GMP-specific phosphodiesterase class I)
MWWGEGVERAEQLAFLTGEGCDLAQGYYFGRPVTHTALLCQHG